MNEYGKIVDEFKAYLDERPEVILATEQLNQVETKLSNISGATFKTKPSKPSIKGAVDSISVRAYSVELESYESAIADWQARRDKFSSNLSEAENLLMFFIESESGVNDLTPEQASKVKEMAWDKGHSYGYYSYAQELDELMDLFNE